jgi:hypothetical protein
MSVVTGAGEQIARGTRTAIVQQLIESARSELPAMQAMHVGETVTHGWGPFKRVLEKSVFVPVADRAAHGDLALLHVRSAVEQLRGLDPPVMTLRNTFGDVWDVTRAMESAAQSLDAQLATLERTGQTNTSPVRQELEAIIDALRSDARAQRHVEIVTETRAIADRVLAEVQTAMPSFIDRTAAHRSAIEDASRQVFSAAVTA